MTTTGLTYIGATDREAQRVWDAWVAAGRPVQLVLWPSGAAHPAMVDPEAER